jgi:hypothetical protein
MGELITKLNELNLSEDNKDIKGSEVSRVKHKNLDLYL